MLADHGHGVAFIDGEDRETAAAGFAFKIHERRAQSFNQHLQGLLALRVVGNVQSLRGAHDVATVERSDLYVGELASDVAAKPVQAVVFDQDPKQVLGFRVPAVLQAFLGQVGVDFCEIFGVPHTVVGLGHHTLAGAANSQNGQAHPFRLGEVAGVERVSEKLVFFLDYAGAGAGPARYFLQFDAQPLTDHTSGGVEFGRATLGHAARKESVLHWFLLLVPAGKARGE